MGRRAVRDHETVPGENPLIPYRLTADKVRRKTEEEIESERLAADNERAHRLRHVYEAIGLAVTAHKDGTLLLRWSLGARASPPGCPRTARHGSRSRPTEPPPGSRLLRARRGPALALRHRLSDAGTRREERRNPFRRQRVCEVVALRHIAAHVA